MNSPSTMVKGKPMAKMFSWGAALVMTPKAKLTTSSAVTAGRAISMPAENSQPPASTMRQRFDTSSPPPAMGSTSKLIARVSMITRWPSIARNISITIIR